MNQVIISQQLEKDLLSACQLRLPYETCGVLYGAELQNHVAVDGYSIIRNISACATSAFSFDPKEWIDIYYQAQKNQRNIVGFFHSHPQGSASPSIDDQAGSIPWKTYCIISLIENDQIIKAYQRDGDQWVCLPLIRDRE